MTEKEIDVLVGFIDDGAFPYIAARACGIPASTWYRWMAWGRKGRQPYRELWDKVQTAGARARGKAEIEIYSKSPLAWLRYGPGRERPGKPGWTDSRQIEHSGPGGEPLILKVIYDDKPDDPLPPPTPQAS